MKKINEIIGDAKTVAISGHIRPDGDCIGSCLSLYNYFQKANHYLKYLNYNYKHLL